MTTSSVTFGSGAIEKIPFLRAFIAPELEEAERAGHGLHIGWGAKPSGRLAASRMELTGGRALFLEDGFLRSFGTGATHPPVSLAVDPIGIYYDATRASLIEHILQSQDMLVARESGEGISAERDVQHAMHLVREKGLSKYNHAPPLAPAMLPKRRGPRVLVVDQTAGDLSIALGLASAETFEEMLDRAISENPEATIYVKTHPEVSSGQKKGHFSAIEASERLVVLRDQIDPSMLLAQMDRVYVVTSTLGFEALLNGKDVTCFGMPWYAGWGLTDDRVTCDRRTRSRTLEEVFAAGYMQYCRYLDPVTRQPGTIFDAIEWLARQKSTEQKLHGLSMRGQLIGVGMRKWKQANLAPLLATLPHGVRFVRNAARLQSDPPSTEDSVLVWGAQVSDSLNGVARDAGARVLRMEDGFIRSVGLGSDLIPPLSLVLDERGIYFDPHQPSDLETILMTADFSADELREAAELRNMIVDFEVTKYNLESRQAPSWADRDGPRILVPGQVEDDASIRLGCPEIKTNLDLLRAVRKRFPDAFVVYKPHPDVWSKNRKGSVHREAVLDLADHIEIGASIISCIAAADEVHTMTSLSGFDALLRGKRVVTYGEPFYSGWGLTEDAVGKTVHLVRRTRALSLDELIAGSLLRYPLYWDDDLRGYTTAQAVVKRVVEARTRLEADGGLVNLQRSYMRRQVRKAGLLIRTALRPF